MNDTRPTATDIEDLRTERDNAQARLFRARNYGGTSGDRRQQVEAASLDVADCQLALDDTVKHRQQW